MVSKQIEFWRSDFGASYAQRGNNRITAEGQAAVLRDWGKILTHATSPRPQSTLEVGCNIGRNLVALSHFIPHLHGIEPNRPSCETARQNPALSNATIQEGDGSALPYAGNSIDLVFTSGVLIHVAPEGLGAVVDEIVRVARHYIVCIEYFSHEPTEVEYHGHSGFLFKRDFGRFYLERHPGLRVLDYGFLWQVLDSADNANWWLFAKD
jgi:pseudaminic acid biosynthesis-associated methylase